MNKLKFAALGMAALAFVACEKENTDPDGNNGGNGGNGGNGSQVDTIAPVASNLTINGSTSRALLDNTASTTASVTLSDNQMLASATLSVMPDFDGFGQIEDQWLVGDMKPATGTSATASFTLSPGDVDAGPYTVSVIVADTAENTGLSNTIELLVLKAGQPNISLPDAGGNTTISTSLQDSPPLFSVKARFDDGESLVYRRLEIYPVDVDANATAFTLDKEVAVSGISSIVTYNEIVPGDAATGTYEYRFTAGDTDGNITVFYGDFIVNP